MDCITTARMIVPHACASLHPLFLLSSQPVLMKGRCSISSASKRHCWFLPISSGGGIKTFSGAAGSGRVLQCQSLLNNEKPMGITFHEYVPVEEQQSFFERLLHAWRILFPSRRRPISNAEIAKQRLKMILISDRCAVNDEAKRIIVTNIIGTLSDFVEIESEEKVQLNVSTDPDLGTVYSVIVPVRRVKPEYQDYSRELINFENREGFGDLRALDIGFELPGNEHM
eukprot:c20521_g1_i1 orf=387-1067(-)